MIAAGGLGLLLLYQIQTAQLPQTTGEMALVAGMVAVGVLLAAVLFRQIVGHLQHLPKPRRPTPPHLFHWGEHVLITWNRSLRGRDLRGEDLADMFLSDVDLSDTDLREANLRGAD